MVIKSLELRNFRLHKNTGLKFSDNLNYIIGGNGQGKTTILEAVYFLCTTKSLLQASDFEYLNFEEEFFEVNGSFSDITEDKVKLFYDIESGRKQTFLNDKQIYRASSLIGRFPVVTLVQSDHFITQGAPGERRKFIDSVISQSSKTYLEFLIDYGKTLRQRSSLLQQIKERRNFNLTDQLESWTETLIQKGVEIIYHRKNFISEFRSYIKNSYNKIMEQREEPEIDYYYQDDSREEIEEKLRSEFNEKKEDELRRGTNLAGPHRDDFLFKINDMELRKYGSQGQHKTFQIALRFGQFFFMNEKMNKTPIFLMDDVFGELDSFRAGKISKYLNEVGQAFITMTDFSNIGSLQKNENDLIINVSDGIVSYE